MESCLAPILAADVVGYSRLVGADTLARPQDWSFTMRVLPHGKCT